jgi:hypothetical protein
MKKSKKIKDMPNITKESNGSIINQDLDGYQKRVKQKRLAANKKLQIETLENKVSRLEVLIERLIEVQAEHQPKKKKVS